MPATISSLAPAKLNSTVIPVKSYTFSPGIVSATDRHSGNTYETLHKISGAEPRITLSVPFRAAYDVIGLGILKLTAFEFYLAKFTDYIRSASSEHTKWALSTSATAVCIISSVSADQDGDLMATVEVVPLAASAAAHPLTKSDGNALPTLASQPALYTLGPTSINGEIENGLRSVAFDLGQNLRVLRSDGDRYARNTGFLGGAPRVTARHADPITLLNDLGLIGANISSNFIQYFRQYDATTGVVSGDSGSGISLTVASGYIEPAELSISDQDLPEVGLQVIPLSATATHPFVISTAATVPAT